MATTMVTQIETAKTNSKNNELLETRDLLAAEQGLRRVLEDKIHSLSIKLSELSAENRRLLSARQESTDSTETLVKQLEQSRIVHYQLEKDLSIARQEYETVEGHLKDVVAQSAQQETKLVQEVARLTAQLDSSKKAHVKDDKLQADLESLMLDTKGEARALQVCLDESREECHNLSEAVTALESINSESAAKIATLQETVEMYEGQFPEALAASAAKKAAKSKAKKGNKYDNVSSRYRSSGAKNSASETKTHSNGATEVVDVDVQAQIDESVKTSAWTLQKQLITDKNLLKKEVDELAAQVQKLKLHEGKLSYENANLTAMVNLLQSRLQYLKVKYEITEEDSVIVPPQQYSHGGGDREHAGNKAIEKSSSISRLRRDMYGTLNAANEIVTFLMNMLTLRKKKKVIQVKYQPNPDEDTNEEPLGAPEGDVSMEEIQVIKSGLSAFLGPLQKTFGAGGKKAQEFEAALALAGAQKSARESPSASPMRPVKESDTETGNSPQEVWELPPPLVDLLPTPQSSDDGLNTDEVGDATASVSPVVAPQNTQSEKASDNADATKASLTPESKSSKERMELTVVSVKDPATGKPDTQPFPQISFLGAAGDIDAMLDGPAPPPTAGATSTSVPEDPRRKLEFQATTTTTTGETTAPRPQLSMRSTRTMDIVAHNVAGGVDGATSGHVAGPAATSNGTAQGTGKNPLTVPPPRKHTGLTAAASTTTSIANHAPCATPSPVDNAGEAVPPSPTGKSGKRKKAVPAWKQVVLDDRAKAQAKRVANREKWANRSKAVANSGLARGKQGAASSASRKSIPTVQGSELLKVRDENNDTAYTLHNTSGGMEANDVTQLVMKTISSSRGGMHTTRKTVL